MWGWQPSIYHKTQKNIAQKLCHFLDCYSDLLLLSASGDAVLRQSRSRDAAFLEHSQGWTVSIICKHSLVLLTFYILLLFVPRKSTLEVLGGKFSQGSGWCKRCLWAGSFPLQSLQGESLLLVCSEDQLEKGFWGKEWGSAWKKKGKRFCHRLAGMEGTGVEWAQPQLGEHLTYHQ